MSKLQTNAIRHLGSSVDNMTFDSTGRVLLPKQPCYSGHRLVNGSDGDVICDSTETNRGNHYNTSTGLFTCPVAGVYYVSGYSCTISSAGAAHIMYVKKNGSRQTGNAYSYNSAGGGYHHVHTAAYINCAAGDTLSVHAGYSGGGVFGDYNQINFALFG